MTRIARVYGPALKMGRTPYNTYDTFPSSVFVEASPIYQTLQVSQRIWGTRSRSSGGATITQTIDQTETATFTRTGLVNAGVSEMPQQSPVFSPGFMAGSGIYDLTNGGASLVGSESGFSVSANAVTADVLFWLPMNEVFREQSGSSGTPSFGFDGLPALPDPKRQRFYVTAPAQSFDYDFTETTTPPGTSTTVTVAISLTPPTWGGISVVTGPARFSLFGWGYSAAESVDTSAWSATKWRDYRGTYVLPAQSMVVGIWTSGTMQRQITITLS
jgi:hypothetical protein